MDDPKIIAVIKFNAGEAYVIDKKINLQYKRNGFDQIIGTDGIFYNSFYYEAPSTHWKAFAGREFDITLIDGEIVHCYGQWWSGGHEKYAFEKNIPLKPVTIAFIGDLIECYCYTGYYADTELIQILRDEYQGKIYEYREYEKELKKIK